MGGVGSGVMTIKITPSWRLALALMGFVGVEAACSGGGSTARAEDGVLDDEALQTTAISGTGGPGVHVTRTDGRSVIEAASYRLTEDRFDAFMAAAEGLAALEQQDSVVRDYLDVAVTDAGAPDAEIGRNWLEANVKARAAITQAGLTVREYYVASIAVAQADRFLRAPRSAPRTPVLLKNAKLLKSHASDLARLRELRDERVVQP